MPTKYRRPIASCDYWEKVERMAESSSREEIDFIMATECEDDFQLAITRNPIATTDDLRWASNTNSIPVMKAVASHPLTDRETLWSLHHRLDDFWREFLSTNQLHDHSLMRDATHGMEGVVSAQEAVYKALGECSATESAKAVRTALRTWLKSTKFSVRQQNAAGFRSLQIRWVDGPSAEQVRVHARLFVAMAARMEWEPLLGPFDRAICFRNAS